VPLQNRVTPWGTLIATPERGTMLGNRGGKFHRDDKTLGRRRWATHHWIACELHYKDMRHEPMGKGYTSLFFLDEVTALAAGHRPCFFCRRQEAKRFMALDGDGLRLDAFDRALHAERLASRLSSSRRKPGPMAQPASFAPNAPGRSMDPGFRRDDEIEDVLPDGTMIAIGEEAFAVRGARLLRWSPGGYVDVRKRKAAMPSLLLTPPRIIAIVARGYRPRWHPSADALIGGDE
jgi:hypothetical protein